MPTRPLSSRPGYSGRPRLGFDHRLATCGRRAVHIWLRLHYPLMGRCEWCATTERSTEYACARFGHQYTRNRADWLELCRQCHRAFDGAYERTPEVRAKIGRAQLGRALSAETRARMRASQRLRRQNEGPEIRAAIGAALKGVKRSPETRERMRIAQRIRRLKEE